MNFFLLARMIECFNEIRCLSFVFFLVLVTATVVATGHYALLFRDYFYVERGGRKRTAYIYIVVVSSQTIKRIMCLAGYLSAR